MSITVKTLSKNLILVFLLCKELKLDFNKIQIIYLLNDKIFWRFIQIFLPAFKIGVNKFYKLNDLAISFYENLNKSNFIKNLSKQEKILFTELHDRLINKYECEDDLYDLKDLLEYAKYNEKTIFNLLLIDGSYIKNVSKKELPLYEHLIKILYLKNKEYKKTSKFKFKRK